jgi:uncharacterized protein
MVQLAAGLAIIAMGPAQLGVRGFAGLTFQPPAAWSRLVRGRARSQAAFAPALLGISSILIPCGVTLSVMALAATSGSPATGAAVMVVFVIGTAPLFTVLGYAAARARRTAGAWARRLAVATGVLVLVMGAYTLNGGLELSGSPLAASQLATTLGLAADPAVADAPAPGSEVTVADGRQTVIVTAETAAYKPGNLQVQVGLPTTLIVRARNAEGCIRAFVIPSRGIQEILPVSGDTPIDLGVLTPGVLRLHVRHGHVHRAADHRGEDLMTTTYTFTVTGMHSASSSTTQYLDEADQLADRIAVIDHGRLLTEGTATELKDRTGSRRQTRSTRQTPGRSPARPRAAQCPA